MQKAIFIFWCSLMLAGCGRRYLERPGVPIMYGMRIDEASDDADLAANLDYLSHGDSIGLLIELALRTDSLGMPVVPYRPSPHSLELLRQSGLSLSLAFATSNAEDLDAARSIRFTDHKGWMFRLDSVLKGTIHAFDGCKLDRIILTSDLAGLDSPDFELWELLRGLKWRSPQALVSFGGRSGSLEFSRMLLISDEVVIDYPPIAGEELKSPSRKENLQIADLASKTGKPVFIYRANVIGEHPVLQIENRLRFWPQEVHLSGLCLNTLYAKIPALDANSYYGLADDADVPAFLDGYQQRGAF